MEEGCDRRLVGAFGACRQAERDHSEAAHRGVARLQRTQEHLAGVRRANDVDTAGLVVGAEEMSQGEEPEALAERILTATTQREHGARYLEPLLPRARVGMLPHREVRRPAAGR